MRRIIVMTLLILSILSAPVLASETARDSFLTKLQTCLNQYQSQQADFKGLTVIQEGSYSSIYPLDSSFACTNTNHSETRINFDEKQAAIVSEYSDACQQPDPTAAPVTVTSSEYYLNGLHYYNAYDDTGLPVAGQYYYDSMPFDNMLYWDVRPGMPDFAESGSSLAYLAAVLPADCFVETGNQVVCNVDQADVDLAYNILAGRIQAGDTEAEAALEILYPAYLGYQFNTDEYLAPLNPEANTTDYMVKETSSATGNTGSYNLKLTVDNNSLSTRTITSSRYVYDPENPMYYYEYHSTVNTVLDARSGQFSKNVDSRNNGVMQPYSIEKDIEGEAPADVAPTTYENVSSYNTVYQYSVKPLALNIPVLNEQNSQPTPYEFTGNAYWNMISY